MSRYLQIDRREGKIERIPQGQTPIIELSLEDHQRVISVELVPVRDWSDRRKTVDWQWSAYIESDLSPDPEPAIVGPSHESDGVALLRSIFPEGTFPIDNADSQQELRFPVTFGR